MHITTPLSVAALLGAALLPLSTDAAPHPIDGADPIPKLAAPEGHRLVQRHVREGPRHRVYINFDGVNVVAGERDDASANMTALGPDFALNYAPFGEDKGGTTRTAIMAAVRQMFADFDIEFVEDRPEQGAYSMIVVSPTDRRPGRNGFASQVCGGHDSAIGFAYFDRGRAGDITEVATTISHELAHTLGLDHSEDSTDIMFGVPAGGEPSFKDQCVMWTAGMGDPDFCAETHGLFCSGTRQQNTWAELFGVIGEIPDDLMGPEIRLITPQHGDHYDVGDDVPIELEVIDEMGVKQVDFFYDGVQLGSRFEAPWGTTITDAQEGVHTIRVEARDGQNNLSDISADIAVGDAVVMSSSGGDDGSASGTGGTSAGANDAGSDTGCGCGTSGAASPGLGGFWAVLWLLGGLRRRRIDAST